MVQYHIYVCAINTYIYIYGFSMFQLLVLCSVLFVVWLYDIRVCIYIDVPHGFLLSRKG